MNRRAFTLIELLVVVAIIGILAAVGVVAYNGYTGAAKVSATKANHKMIAKMIGAKGIKCSIGDEVDYLDIGFSALGLWGVVGLWNIERNKKK